MTAGGDVSVLAKVDVLMTNEGKSCLLLMGNFSRQTIERMKSGNDARECAREKEREYTQLKMWLPVWTGTSQVQQLSHLLPGEGG